MYDLIRLARALKMSNAQLRTQLIAHSTALECELQDSQGHLLAALGRMHIHLEHFPERNFVRTFLACWQSIQHAIGDQQK